MGYLVLLELKDGLNKSRLYFAFQSGKAHRRSLMLFKLRFEPGVSFVTRRLYQFGGSFR